MVDATLRKSLCLQTLSQVQFVLGEMSQISSVSQNITSAFYLSGKGELYAVFLG